MLARRRSSYVFTSFKNAQNYLKLREEVGPSGRAESGCSGRCYAASGYPGARGSYPGCKTRESRRLPGTPPQTVGERQLRRPGRRPRSRLATFVVGATLSVPIFTGGRIAGEIKLAGLRVEQLQQELMRLKLAVAQERVRSSTELEAGRETAQAAGASAAAAKTSLDLVRLRFGAGMATNVDVVTAQSRLAESQELEIRSHYNAMLAKARLARAKGNLMAYFD